MSSETVCYPIMMDILIKCLMHDTFNADQLSIWERTFEPSFSRWTCTPTISNRRGTLYCLQTLWSCKALIIYNFGSSMILESMHTYTKWHITTGQHFPVSFINWTKLAIFKTILYIPVCVCMLRSVVSTLVNVEKNVQLFWYLKNTHYTKCKS